MKKPASTTKNIWKKKRNIVLNSFGRSCFAWTVLNNIKTEKGLPIEFKDRRFLMDIYDDWTPIQVANKSSQVGFSTMEIIKSLWGMKYKNYNFIYTLPTFSDVQQFVPSKVNSIIRNNPVLINWTQDKDTTLQKKVGDSFIYYRGTFSQKTDREKMESGVGIMLSADCLVMDESDRSDQVILEQYESRLDASDYKGRWYFSNKTHPQTLSESLYQKSDQKHWFISCGFCNEWQYLSWPDSINKGKYVCKKCGKELTDDDRRNGQWIKKYRDREISGYYINHLMCPWISADTIEKQSKNKTKQYFYNFVLGLPYRGSDITVDKDLIGKCIDYSVPNFLQNNVMGVDSGLKKHYIIGNKQGIFKVGITEKWEDVEFLLRKYDIGCCVIDALPDLTEPRKLKERYPGIVWLSFFKKEVKKADFITWDDKTNTVYSDRSKIIQQVIDEFTERKLRFQMILEDLGEYIKHWSILYRIEEFDNMNIKRDIWESQGEDHFAFATIYFRLALERSGEAILTEWKKEEKSAILSPLEVAEKNLINQKQDWRI